jgi:hypothetical protein
VRLSSGAGAGAGAGVAGSSNNSRAAGQSSVQIGFSSSGVGACAFSLFAVVSRLVVAVLVRVLRF